MIFSGNNYIVSLIKKPFSLERLTKYKELVTLVVHLSMFYSSH